MISSILLTNPCQVEREDEDDEEPSHAESRQCHAVSSEQFKL